MQFVQATNTPSIRELGVDEIDNVSGACPPCAVPVVKIIVKIVAADVALIAGTAAYLETREQD
ncbi:hypothetical protein RYZ27_09030 [Hyphomonas sp. FCG-A18]|uniref:hypothetical protein n=1 Tax=Hyphomonas sp. FCG-A18 TaxID=3080019 RepID=UPI002B2A18FD|nr:hypothetical protein RYZ27_09030 [Hyphomonas sp. FCG-A18]